MKTKRKTHYVHEGKYVAALDVELIEDEQGWSPYLSVEDAYRIDDVRKALRQQGARTQAVLMSIYRTLKRQRLDPAYEITQALSRFILNKQPPTLPKTPSGG